MTLLITSFAAVISTVIWYVSDKARKLNTGVLCCSYWGASLMWFVDSVFEYAELKSEFFVFNGQEMLNDSFLGLSVVALALIVWVVIMLIKDPDRVLKSVFK
ncbi:hypothetical protein [Porcipelethomonas sp.]|uniref:hypothetical protein n=1 Tax=Porcipelethomonas sp. TaxID=2981675 RepID=UPI003EF73EE5